MKKTLAVILIFALVLTAIPAAAFAQDQAQTPDENPSAVDISAAVIRPIENKTFTGSEITLSEDELVVKVGETVLSPETDYTASYGSNLNVGQAEVTLTGKGNYTGTVSANFTIEPKIFDEDEFPDMEIPHQPVNPSDSSVKGTILVWKGITLTEHTDYTVTGDNSSTGTKTANFTFMGNYGGKVSALYRVYSDDISGMDLEIALPEKGLTYNGKAHKPPVSVKKAGTALLEGVDYNVTYENNVNAGTASVKVIGAGDYAGELNGEFTIKKAKGSITTGASVYNKYTNSKTFSLHADTNTDAQGLTFTSSNTNTAKVSASGKVTITGSGKAVITIKTIGTKNFEPAEKKVTISAAPLKPSVKLSSPKKGRIAVQITKVSGATKYQVKYGRMGKYYSKYVTHKNDGKKTVTVNIDKRRKNTNYFIKVRSYKKLSDGTIVWGNWTTLKKIKAK